MTSFGDNVRIKSSPETEAGGYAGLTGQCFGFTTPSVTNVEVVGAELPGDAALSIHFDAEGIPDTFFHPDLVEMIDHAPGSTMRIGDGPELVRDADGEWHPVGPDPN